MLSSKSSNTTRYPALHWYSKSSSSLFVDLSFLLEAVERDEEGRRADMIYAYTVPGTQRNLFKLLLNIMGYFGTQITLKRVKNKFMHTTF